MPWQLLLSVSELLPRTLIRGCAWRKKTESGSFLGVLHTTVKLNWALTGLPPSELISVRADYPELPLAAGGAAVAPSSSTGLNPLRNGLKEIHSAQTSSIWAAPQAPDPEVHISVPHYCLETAPDHARSWAGTQLTFCSQAQMWPCRIWVMSEDRAVSGRFRLWARVKNISVHLWALWHSTYSQAWAEADKTSYDLLSPHLSLPPLSCHNPEQFEPYCR